MRHEHREPHFDFRSVAAAVRLLLMTTLRDVVRQGREHELNPLLAECSAPGRRCTSNGFAVARMRGHSRGGLNEV